MLVCASLSHADSSQQDTKKYVVIKHLEAAMQYYISRTNLSSAFLHDGSGENPASYSLRLLSLEFSGRYALAAV